MTWNLELNEAAPETLATSRLCLAVAVAKEINILVHICILCVYWLESPTIGKCTLNPGGLGRYHGMCTALRRPREKGNK